MKLIYSPFGLMLTISVLSGCTKFVEVQPPITSIVGTAVYSSNATAAGALTGIYENMANNSVGGGYYGISALLGISADELSLYAGFSNPFLYQTYTNSQESNTKNNNSFIWGDLYNLIYQSNSAIEGISASMGVTPTMKVQLIGEAKFTRAFCNFYLVNIYGDVPLVTSTDYQTNAVISRSPKALVYQAIINDLKDADSLLSDNYLAPDGSITSERVRPNRGAVNALLARVYLYMGDWGDAETYSDSVINSTGNYSLVSDLNGVFLANSSEAIWQLEPPNNGYNTPDAYVFLLSLFGGPNANNPYILSDSLVESFEPGDLRRVNWVDSIIVSPQTYYCPYKYKVAYTGSAPIEYPMVLRLAEQYLIRAEARAEEGNLGGAQADLDAIRERAGLTDNSSTTIPDLLSAIQRERRFELFTEYGHRWLDLKRIGLVDPVMSIVTPEKGGNWNSTAQLFAIPFSEIQEDPNIKQNAGYN